MEKNKTGKYLKYAVGEIMLVVIGILIALQINNWNEERKKFIKSKNYLSDIVKDLQSDSITLNSGIYIYTYFIEFEEWALKQSSYQPNQVDSLWICFGGFYFDIPLNDRTFQKIQNSGLIGWILFMMMLLIIIQFQKNELIQMQNGTKVMLLKGKIICWIYKSM